MRLREFLVGMVAAAIVFPAVGALARLAGLEAAAVPLALTAWPLAALWFVRTVKERPTRLGGRDPRQGGRPGGCDTRPT